MYVLCSTLCHFYLLLFVTSKLLNLCVFYIIYSCFLVCNFFSILYILYIFIVLCIVSHFVYSSLFPISVQFTQTLTLGGNTIAVNKYLNLLIPTNV